MLALFVERKFRRKSAGRVALGGRPLIEDTPIFAVVVFPFGGANRPRGIGQRLTKTPQFTDYLAFDAGPPQNLLPVHKNVIADAPVHQIDHRALGHFAIWPQAQVGEQQDGVAIGRRDRIDLGLDDDRPGETKVDLFGGQAVRMRMIPVRPCASFGQRE